MTCAMSCAGQTSAVRHLGAVLLVDGPSRALEVSGITGKGRFHPGTSRVTVQHCLEAPLPAVNVGHAGVMKCQTGYSDLNLELLMHTLHSTAWLHLFVKKQDMVACNPYGHPWFVCAVLSCAVPHVPMQMARASDASVRSVMEKVCQWL